MNFLELPLFQSLSDQELEQMKTSGCLRTASYKKNDIIFSTGSTVSEIGIVLSGSVNVENIDFWGNMNEGHIFAETYALCREPMMVDAVAASNCEILFLNLKVLQEKNCTSSWYSKIQRSLLAMCSRKNLMLSDLSVRTVPETRQPSFSDSVRPAANGRLPESGSQCPVKRTFPYEKRRDLRFSQKRICFKK